MAPFSIILVGEFCVTIYRSNQINTFFWYVWYNVLRLDCPYIRMNHVNFRVICRIGVTTTFYVLYRYEGIKSGGVQPRTDSTRSGEAINMCNH